MSLFTLIKYPVDKRTADFNHIPDDIWDKYMAAREKASDELKREDHGNNCLIIKIIMDWDDPES